LENVEDARQTCSFCKKAAREVRTLIAGPDVDVYICDECVETCVDILAGDDRRTILAAARAKAERFRSSAVSRVPGASPCGLCGTPLLRGEGVVVEGGALVCLGCGHATAAAMGPVLRRIQMMSGVIIRDGTESGGKNALEFDLRDVLDALGPRAARSRWHYSGLCYTSASGQDIEAFERSPGDLIDGTQLIAAAQQLQQVIDGHFEAFENENTPWVVVRAVDSAWWEVWSDDHAVLDAVRSRFKVVEESRR
jgi:hypothetical protein